MTLIKRSEKGAALSAADHDGNLDHVLERGNHLGTLPDAAPDHSPDADIALASQGQALVAVYDPEEPVVAGPDRILAVIGDDAQAALTTMGLTLIPEPK